MRDITSPVLHTITHEFWRNQVSENFDACCEQVLRNSALKHVSDKDYVTANAVEVILACPKALKSEDINYMEKNDFGKIPKYIERIKRDIEKENAEAAKLRERAELEASARQRLLPDDERRNMVAGLKSRWDSLNTEYQRISHRTVLDTFTKIRHKEYYESQLKQVEKDLDLLSRNEEIMIDLEH